MDRQMMRNWFIYSLVALALVSLVAFILPTNYTYGILSLLRYLLNLVATVFYFFILLIFSGIAGLVKLFALLFKTDRPPMELPAMPSLPDMPESVEQVGPAAWVKLLQSILFWAVFMGIIGYALIQYLRQNRELVEKLRKVRGFRWLREAFRWLSGRLRGFNQAAVKALAHGVQRLRAMLGLQEREAFSYINLRRMSPRQKVLFYYLALVRRGSETGIKRNQAQTPYEYSRSLKNSVSEMDEPVEEITAAFVEARYSRHVVEEAKAGMVKQAWERIRQVLRQMGKPRS